jgi:quinol monooxygenase YgiN
MKGLWMILAILHLVVTPEKRDDAIRILRTLIGPTQVQPGCLSCCVCQGIDEPRALTMMQEWTSQSELERHIRSDDYRKLLAVMDMASEPPIVEFHTIARTSGMETIQDVRVK